MLKVEYASLRTLHTGSVAAIGLHASTTLAPSLQHGGNDGARERGEDVGLHAAAEAVRQDGNVEFSVRRIWTLSPQSSSLNLLMLLNAASMCIFIVSLPS